MFSPIRMLTSKGDSTLCKTFLPGLLRCLLLATAVRIAAADEAPRTMADFRAMIARRAAEQAKALASSRFAVLKHDYFARFSRDRQAKPRPGEVVIGADWTLLVPADADPLVRLMAGHLAEFFEQRMELPLPRAERQRKELAAGAEKAIVLTGVGGGDADVPESFTITVSPTRVRVAGRDPAGLRDGVVRLVDAIGFRRAPFLAVGSQVYRPRIRLREGAHGSYRDTVFMGYNAVLAGGGSLYAVSTSDAIPELAARRAPGAFKASYKNAAAARKYGLKTYFHLSTARKFPADAPVFKAHPDIRGALTWKADGQYTLCTEHPLVQKFLTDTVEQIFRRDPKLDGITIIIGGEGFYHCFMRPYGVAKGHTNCRRCEALGAETVVANLCNRIARAARRVNPNAQVLAWPYSAAGVWSKDKAQLGFIKRLEPGVTLLTEMVKDEVVDKPDGVHKLLWDYSIDLIGPGKRARNQIEACHRAGIPIRVLSMAEETFEASLLPHIPCLDRWADRANALASCGADSVYVFQMGPYDASTAAEVNKFFWWDPVPDKDLLLERLAARVAGAAAGPHLRKAWHYVSEAIDDSPEIGPYYRGPGYLGPAHPMCADPAAKVPPIFYGYYLFLAEMTPDEAFRGRPTFFTSPRGNRPVFEHDYQRMAERLRLAAEAMNAARSKVPAECRLTFDAEDVSIQWFYRTVRTEVNFYASCRFRDELAALAKQPALDEPARHRAAGLCKRWRAVLLDERANARAALPLAKADPRLDCYYRGDHSFAHTTDMIRAKLKLLDHELAEVVPGVARRLGVDAGRSDNALE